jgi:hypothetical protein
MYNLPPPLTFHPAPSTQQAAYPSPHLATWSSKNLTLEEASAETDLIAPVNVNPVD